MATAYHLEALRKQRVLDRAYEAKEKLEKTVKLSINLFYYIFTTRKLNIIVYTACRLAQKSQMKRKLK